MRWLLFVARVTFICNLFFILCLLIRHTHFTVPLPFTEFVIITGWIMSVVFNVLFTVSLTIAGIRKKATALPFWLKAANILIFVFQVVYYLISVV